MIHYCSHIPSSSSLIMAANEELSEMEYNNKYNIGIMGRERSIALLLNCSSKTNCRAWTITNTG